MQNLLLERARTLVHVINKNIKLTLEILRIFLYNSEYGKRRYTVHRKT